MQSLAPVAEIKSWFGEPYVASSTRAKSYSMLEDFIAQSHIDWTKTPDTNAIAENFTKELKKLKKNDFAFLLCHTGYIPETYPADSSQETLYSKLVEVLVHSWAVKIGFDRSTLPTMKSGTEDITIMDENHIIVCDAKTYRLGRSQKAPNVKDALKQANIKDWLAPHPVEKHVGGLITFPSQHDWSKGSDFYKYLTDKNSPVAMLFYEHLSYMILADVKKDCLLKFYKGHSKLFPKTFSKKEGNRNEYFQVVNSQIIDHGKRPWAEFSSVANFIKREKATHTLNLLKKHLEDSRAKISAELPKNMDVKVLLRELEDARFVAKNKELIRQAENIRKFRDLL